MSEIPYKGYIIRPKSLPLAAGGWNLEVYIEKHRGNSVTIKEYGAANTFKTEEEAIQHCIIFGKQIIDGKVDISPLQISSQVVPFSEST